MAPDLSTFHYPHRTSTSSYRVPTPPRIVVPPPALNSASLPEITLKGLGSLSLPDISSDKAPVPSNALLDWTYERRREAQMILPYLYLGPLAAVKDEAWLRREGITCVLAIRQMGTIQTRLMNAAMSKPTEMGIETHAIDATDNQDLVQKFSATSVYIHQHVANRLHTTGQLGKVLVFCESGNERSAGVAAAYLMEAYEDVDYIKAMQLCQAQRFCVNFDDGLKRLLQGYWDILCAKRQVAAVQQQAPTNNTNAVMQNGATGKRALERDVDEDEVMDGADDDDMARFGGRQFAPFVDQPL